MAAHHLHCMDVSGLKAEEPLVALGGVGCDVSGDTWLGDALRTLQSRRPLVPPPDAEMPAFKPPDNTDDSQGDSW